MELFYWYVSEFTNQSQLTIQDFDHYIDAFKMAIFGPKFKEWLVKFQLWYLDPTKSGLIGIPLRL